MINQVIDFWFKDISPSQWWKKDARFDEMIRDRFLSLFQDVKKGQHLDWLDHAKGCLARVIVLDQFSRNMFRDTAAAFETDPLALSTAKHAIAKGFDHALHADEKVFLYMPFMHSEQLLDQQQSLELFAQTGHEGNLDFARRHHAIIEKFGRFPHRNEFLHRVSMDEERAFLLQPGSRF